MKPIILHDYLNQYGGAERVLELLHDCFPCKIFTLVWNKKKIHYRWNIQTSIAQHFPLSHKHLMPFFPIILRFQRFKRDLIISSSHAYIKNINKPKNSLHICYCHTPMRYAWDLKEEYLRRENPLLRPFISIFLRYLRWWDRNGSKNVDFFIANSQNVGNRIRRFYNRDSVVIHPPVDTKQFALSTKKRQYYYLIVSRLIEYKRTDLAIKAFNKTGKRLIIVGTGRDEKMLKKIAKKNIEFKGFIPALELVKYYQNAKALIHPQLEDAGIACLESQSAGTPVIAYGKGGALETVIEGKTGHFFHEQTPQALIKAIEEFEQMKFSPKACRNNALRFDKEIFKKKIKAFVEEKYAEWKKLHPKNGQICM